MQLLLTLRIDLLWLHFEQEEYDPPWLRLPLGLSLAKQWSLVGFVEDLLERYETFQV